MSNARGDEAKLLSRIQAAFGTAEAAGDGTFLALPFYSMNVTPSEELNEDASIYGDAYPGDAVPGLQNMAGSIVVPMGLESIGWHLRNLFGDPVTSDITTGVSYAHVFTTSAQPDVGLLTNGISHTRIDQHFVQDSIAYSGLEFQARKNGERARVTLNAVGRAETPAGATLDATPVIYEPDPVPVGFQAAALFDAAPAAAVTGGSLSINHTVEADQETLNGLPTAARIERGMWENTGSIDARFTDRDIYDKANAGTAFDLHFKWVYAADHELEIIAHKVRLERTGIPIDGRGVISSSFNFRANRPASGQVMLTATLKNRTASYANPA